MKTPYNPNMNKIIKFFRERPILSLVLIFGLWVNSLPLPDANIGTVRQYNPLETTISNQKALAVSGGDGFTNPYSSDRGPTPKGASDRGEDRFVKPSPPETAKAFWFEIVVSNGLYCLTVPIFASGNGREFTHSPNINTKDSIGLSLKNLIILFIFGL